MIYNYYQIIDQIYHSEWVSKRLARFKNFQSVLEQIWPKGHPTKIIQVAGTNGKGSTVKFLESGFTLTGSTGSFTNPHLFDFKERFSINGKNPEEIEIIDIWEKEILPIIIRQAGENTEHILYFSEICILIALKLFEYHQVEWGIMETGCGGRYERLTQLPAEGAVVTNVGEDHPLSLGEKSWQRALDKAGICRREKPFFTSEMNPLHLDIFKETCTKFNSPLIKLDTGDINNIKSFVEKNQSSLHPDNLLFNAPHQLKNAALSLKVLTYFYPHLDRLKVIHQFIQLKYLGRFTKFDRQVFIDIAHNQDKIQALVTTIKATYPHHQKYFLIGLSNNRSALKVLPPVVEIADKIVLTSASHRGVDPQIIKQELSAWEKGCKDIEVITDPRKAYHYLKSCLTPHSLLFVTGSAYMIDQAVNPDQFLSYLNYSYGWRNNQKQ
ncbi:MAG: glutamate ligase domain-containing protein [bacterium]